MFGGKGVEGNKEGVVNGACIEEQSTEDFLDARDGLGIESRGRVFRKRELDFGAICWGSPRMRGVLGPAWCRVLKTLKSFLDVSGHGDITSSFGPIPLESDAAVEGCVPVDSGFIVGGQRFQKVIGISTGGVTAKEIVDNEAEENVV